jgi:Ca2+-binding RTX toxin-like protein
VVVILDADPTVQKAGRFLYEKHDTSSHVLMWNGTAELLKVAEWNTDIGTYEEARSSSQQLPIGTHKTFSWSDTLIQIIGSGNIKSPEISGFSAEKLATVITGELAHGDVGRIDIIGYGAHEYTPTSEPPAYLSQFMYTLKQLGRLSTAATVRASLASLDHSGRELTGQLYLGTNTTDIEWNHNMAPFDTWVGYFTGENYQLEQLGPSTVLQSPFFGVLPEGIEVHVTDYQQKSVDGNPPAYAVTDKTAFEWVDSVAQSTYQAIPNSRAPSVSRRVQFLFDAQEIRDVPVTEISSVADLLKELRYYGDKGPADSNTENYCRFGDWIVVMNEADFYVTVRGIVISSTDSSVKRAKVENILSHWRTIPVLYPNMQPSTGANFFADVTSWVNGESNAIGLEMENAYNAQCGVAMFLSEAIRSFHTHITNMMSLDLAHHGYLTKEYFFSTHPMARRGTWQIHYTTTGKQKTGLALLQDELARSGLLPDEDVQTVFDEIVHRISRISKSWLSHVDNDEIKGSRDLPPATKRQEYTLKDDLGLIAALESIGSIPPASNTFLREYELHESFDRLLSANMSEPETGAIGTQVIDFSHIDDVTLPLHASIALVNDHTYVSDLISREIHQKQLETGKVYQVVPNSIDVDDESDIVKFFVKEVADVSSELEQVVTEIKKFRLQSKALIEKFLSLSNKTKPFVTWLKKGEGLINAVKGITSSIHQLESGNLVEELKGAYRNIYKIGNITGINKAAGEYIGKALKKLTEDVSKSIVTAAGIVNKTEGTLSSLIGKFSKLKAKFAPIISAVEGIYNIYEDFKQHTTLGYINAAFDIAKTVLSFFGPKAARFEAALSLIQTGVDYFYTDISRELHALPPHASIGRIVVAVLKGIFNGIVEHILHNIDIFAVIGDAHMLDKQYDNDRRFLQELSDYRNYFKISRGDGSNVSEINFADGSESWNGGDITFRLGEDGHSTLTMEGVNSDGNPTHATEVIDTPGVEDIVLGIGESHSVSFQTETVNILFFKIDSKRVISRVDGEKQTLYGTYYGNSQNNKFIAVQELTPQAESNLGYNLHDYHYTLYGGGGNDTFYLGPQPTYVEGNEGSDAYFINSTSTCTEINSHTGDGQRDTMIINLNFNQLTAKREGLNLNLTSSNTHRIVIRNWFHDVTHQRMVFKTGDGVLFKVSATITEAVDLIAYALSGQGATNSGVYDARLPQYAEVATIAGSEHDDVLYGNDLDNQLNGAGGNDRHIGGEGQDTYHVDLNKGVDIINNFALDGEVDTLVIGTRLDQLNFSSHEDSDDLFISHVDSTEDESSTPSTGATISNWFLDETYQHLIVVTEDKAVVKVSSVKNSTVSYQSLIVNMSQIEEQLAKQGLPYSRRLDLNSDQKYSAVVTVFGTPYNDTIIGNGKDNYITGGQGLDYIEGREGVDTYIVKEGDESTKILNCAKDTSMDTLLLAAKFDDIELLNNSNSDLLLMGNDLDVTMKNWFHSKECQHLLVRSADGVTFTLPNVVGMDLMKTAKSVDNSNLTTDVQLILSGKWATVEHVTGSQGDDSILGNSLDNYIDPGLGNSYLQGGNGSDTYVIRSTYGEDNIINNYAEDDLTDTILFLVPYLTIQIEMIGMDVRLTSLSGDGLVGVRIMDYNFQLLEHARHLVFSTSDGISFILPVANDTTTSSNYKPIPISINMAQATTGQHIHLTAYTYFTEVRTVYGSSRYQNTIIGNGQNNTLVGGVNADLIQGLDGDDVLKGGDGNDVIEGGFGSDTLVGGDGDDNLDGGGDNDVFSPGSGTNQIDGGSGTDTVIYSGDVSKEEGISLDLIIGTCIHDGNAQDTLSNIENAYGTEYDDMLQGDDKDNVLVGQGGNDYLAPGSGYDILNGGNGNDTYDLSTANGTVTIENYADDGTWDLVIMGYANLPHIWYEIVGHDVIVRAISVQYPVFYDGGMPAVVFKSFMVNSKYQHANLEMADGSRVNLADFITDRPQTTPKSPTSTSKSIPTSTSKSIIYTLDSSTSTQSSQSPGSALALLLLTLCVFIGFVVLGVYKLVRNPHSSDTCTF